MHRLSWDCGSNIFRARPLKPKYMSSHLNIMFTWPQRNTPVLSIPHGCRTLAWTFLIRFGNYWWLLVPLSSRCICSLEGWGGQRCALFLLWLPIETQLKWQYGRRIKEHIKHLHLITHTTCIYQAFQSKRADSMLSMLQQVSNNRQLLNTSKGP